MTGELAALLSALLWAMSSVLITVGAKRLHVLPLNLVRCALATVVFWSLLPVFGGFQALAAISPLAWLWLFVSVLGLLVVGDTLYFRSMDLAGVSWAMPVASIHPLWAVLLAWLLVGEPLTWSLALGALLVVSGIILVSRPSRRRTKGTPSAALRTPVMVPAEEQGEVRARRTGLLMAVAASFLWAGGQVALKPAAEGLDPVVASSARQAMAALILLGLTLSRGRWRDLLDLDRRSWAIIGAASLFGTVVGTWLFIYAIQAIGAGRNAVLGATAPMMAIPFSVIWLQERPARWTVVGTLLTVVGVVLIV